MDGMEEIKMTLNIGGTRIALTVPFTRQDFVRDVEGEVNRLYHSWRHQFAGRTDREIMAMMAYQFASYYYELRERYKQAGELTGRCAAALEKLCGTGPAECDEPEGGDAPAHE